MLNRRSRGVGSLVRMLLVAAAGTTGSLAQAQTIHPDFHVSWGIQAPSNLNFDIPEAAQIRRSMVLFPGTWFGMYPAQGPHIIEMWPDGKEAFYAGHFERLRREVEYRIPSLEWTGYAVIDWELWSPNWCGATTRRPTPRTGTFWTTGRTTSGRTART
jgi:hypothetical protein